MKHKFSNIIGTVGSIIGVFGWFIFKSKPMLIIGTICYLIEMLIEKSQLQKNAIYLDIAIFSIGCIIGIFLKQFFIYYGMLFINIYSLILSIIELIMLRN